MEHSHHCLNEVEVRKALVDSQAHRLERIDSIIVLDELIVGATHPREAELASKSRIDKHGNHLNRRLVDCIDLALASRLCDLADESNDVLVNKISIQILRAYGHNAGLADKRAKALQRGQDDPLVILHAVKLRKYGHYCSLEERVDTLGLGEEKFGHLGHALEQLCDQVLQVCQILRAA